jgi:2-polyprenyl-3-methyl-5-hydroxy-6-metoxy-1,4-benzoquinol methylase
VVECGVCGFVYVSPIETMRALIEGGPVLDNDPDRLRTSADLADLKGRWEEPVIEEYVRELAPKQANARDALRRIARWHTSKGTILDVGCFCGIFLSVAKGEGWQGTGLEPLIGPSIYARAHFGLPVVNDVLRETTFQPEAFEVVTAFQVFEHLIHPEEEVAKIKTILKPGGLVLIEVPNIATPLVTLMGRRHRHYVQDHVSFFSAKTLTRLLEQQGFKVREVYYPARVLSVRHLLWWLNKVGLPGNWLAERLPQGWLATTVPVSLGDIVAVIAQK